MPGIIDPFDRQVAIEALNRHEVVVYFSLVPIAVFTTTPQSHSSVPLSIE